MPAKKKPENPRKGEPRGDTRVSLSPLGFEEALKGLMDTGKPADDVPDELEDVARNAIEYPADETGEG